MKQVVYRGPSDRLIFTRIGPLQPAPGDVLDVPDDFDEPHFEPVPDKPAKPADKE